MREDGAFGWLADWLKEQSTRFIEMAVLENARIIADTTSKYHVINRATVSIKGRRVYEASGFYEYNVGPYEQEFELQNITGQPIGKGAYSEKRSVTRAVGEILPSDTFFIDHKTQFRGDILLDAEKKARLHSLGIKPRNYRQDKKSEKNNIKWQVQYNKLKEYRNEHGNCNVPRRYEVNPSLGNWVKNQRYEYPY